MNVSRGEKKGKKNGFFNCYWGKQLAKQAADAFCKREKQDGSLG